MYPICPPTTDTPAVLSTEPSMFLVRTSHIQTWKVPSHGWDGLWVPKASMGLG